MKPLFRRAAARLDAVHANHKRIARGALFTGVFVLIAKACVAGREVAIAWRYGVGETVDAYQLAFTLSTWLPLMVVSIAGVVLVPRLVALLDDHGRRRAFIDEANFGTLALAVAIGIATSIAAPAAVGLIGGPMGDEARALAARMMQWFAPVALLTVTGGWLAIRLQARETYVFGLAEAAPALAVIALLVATPFGPATWPLIAGTLIGFLLQTLLLAGIAQAADGGLGRFAPRATSGVWRALFGSIVFMALGQLVLNIALPLDQAFAARIGEGAIATLGYVNRIVGLITGLAAVILARALLPVLSRVASNEELALGHAQTIRWTVIVFAVALAASAAAWVFAPLGVELLFERGAFSAEDSAAVAGALRFGLVQVPFYCAALVSVQWIAAQGRHAVLFYVAVPILILKVVLNFAFWRALGVPGILLATALMYAASLVLQLGYMRWAHAQRR